MECDAAGVDGGHAGRGGDNHSFCRILFQLMQKGGFAGTGLTRQKYIAPRVLNKVAGQFQFMV